MSRERFGEYESHDVITRLRAERVWTLGTSQCHFKTVSREDLYLGKNTEYFKTESREKLDFGKSRSHFKTKGRKDLDFGETTESFQD